MKIIDNLQVFIDDIHIRFEDPIHNLSLGITISYLHVQSVNEKWEPGIIGTGQKILRKLADLRNLAVYLNCGTDFIQYSNQRDFVNKMSSYIYKDEDIIENHYIIAPMSGTLKLNVNTVDKDFSRPKVIADLLVSSSCIEVDSNQYRSVFTTLDFFTTYIKSYKYLKYKPNQLVRPTEDPAAFWKYFIQAEFDEINKKKSKMDRRKFSK